MEKRDDKKEEEDNFKTKKNIRNIISAIVIFITSLLLIYYIYKNTADFKELYFVNPIYILALSFLFVLGLFVNSVVLRVLMEPFNIKLKKGEAFGLSAITNFYNFITPFKGGAGMRALYLKKKHDFSYINFLATLSAIYVIIFLVACIFGLFSMGLIYWFYKIFNPIIFLMFFLLFVFLLGIIIFSPKVPMQKNKLLNKIATVINGWHLIKNNYKVILFITFFSSVQLMLCAISTMIAYYTFGFNLSFLKALFISCVGSLSVIVSITPGNLGIGDAINIFSANLMGVGLSQAVAANLLLRAVNILVILILGPIFSYYLLRKKFIEEE